jgi:hypothetical protein
VHVLRGQKGGKLDNTRLVGHGNQRARHGDNVRCGT